MPCTKTGCHIFIEPYGEYAYGDAFELNDVAYFRLVQRSQEPLFPRLHFTVWNYDSWFDADSPMSTMVSADYANLGYEGKPL